MIKLTRQFRFEAAHFLPHYDGACANMHGHSYKLEVTVTGRIISDTENPKCGMIIDFKDLDKIVNDSIISEVDHSLLNHTFKNPTAELMVSAISEKISKCLPKGVLLVSCKLWETENSYAEYTTSCQRVTFSGEILSPAT